MNNNGWRRIGLFVAFTMLLANVYRTMNDAEASVKKAEAAGRRLHEEGTLPPKIEFKQGAAYAICFVPDGPACESLLVDRINQTKSSLLIQAYSFTSQPIAQAVVNAHKRGVKVQVILDKSQRSERYTSATFIKNAGISVAIDTKPAIAHNKVMIFDQAEVFTGSFNFTKSAQERNAENGILIAGDSNVVKAYTDNWNARLRESTFD